MEEVIETFGFLLSQRIATSPLTPKDTTRMAKSFPATFKIKNGSKGPVISFKTPFYTKYVHDGTRKMKARPFVNQILNEDGERLLKESFRIVDARYKNK
jgi:hypothetical protein